MRRLVAASILGILFATAPLIAQADPQRRARVAAPAKGQLNAKLRPAVVTVAGKQYYRTFRVTSENGFKRITDKNNGFRFFQGGGQYGEGFYLFQNKTDAKRFVKAERTRGANREVIAEVLLPKAKFDAVNKSEVTKGLDWGMFAASGSAPREQLRGMRLASHILFGSWAPSPAANEPFYNALNGASQLAVVQLGQPSILMDSLIRRLDK